MNDMLWFIVVDEGGSVHAVCLFTEPKVGYLCKTE